MLLHTRASMHALAAKHSTHLCLSHDFTRSIHGRFVLNVSEHSAYILPKISKTKHSPYNLYFEKDPLHVMYIANAFFNFQVSKYFGKIP